MSRPATMRGAGPAARPGQPARAGSAGRADDWLTIHEASALVGVSVASLRRWCDAGEVRAFTTPGGHRRFARSALLALLPATERRPLVAADGETAIRIVRAYRREISRDDSAAHGWPAALNAVAEPERVAFRQHGRQMIAALVEVLDAAAGENSRHYAAACDGARGCGRLAARGGLSLADTLALFVRFRAPFLHELGALAGRRGLDAAATTAILERASDAIDQLLPALVEGHAANAEPALRTGAPALLPEPA
jgi:excisionase family DNA binding protein